jgi:cytoskeleton protein RodZ
MRRRIAISCAFCPVETRPAGCISRARHSVRRDDMNIGGDLRHAREQRGWSLEELSIRTRIAVSKLAAIEANSFERLPEGFYRRAYLRAYAREVGLDSERVVDSYRTQFSGDAEMVKPAVATNPPAPPVSRKYLDWLHIQLMLLAILGTAAAIALVVVVLRHPDTLAPISEVPRSTTTAEARAIEPPAVGTGGGSASASVAPVEGTIVYAPLQVEVLAQGPCWLGATADGKRVVYRVLNKGERLTLEAREDLALRIGDAGNFRFTVNGIPGRRLGDAGDDLTVHLTPTNFRKFVQSS